MLSLFGNSSVDDCHDCQQLMNSMSKECKDRLQERLDFIVRRKQMFRRRRINAVKLMHCIQGAKPRGSDQDLDGYSIDYGSVLFHGKFSTIYDGKDNSGVGRERIAKVFELKKLNDRLRFRLENSGRHLRYLRLHQNSYTVHIQEIFSTPDKMIIFMEKTSGLNLSQVVKSRLGEEEAMLLSKDISSSICYLHERGIAHDNINGKHIIIKNGVPKLSGFEWSVVYFDHVKDEVIKQEAASKQHFHDHWSPEKTRVKYDPSKADVWSFGVLVLHLMTMEDKPFDFKSSLRLDLQWKLLFKRHGVHLSDQVFKILSRCFEEDPDLRSDIVDVMLSIKLNHHDSLAKPFV